MGLKGNKKAIILLVLVLATLAVIWGHSMMNAAMSMAESDRAETFLTPLLELFVGKGNVTSHLVRKLGHFAEFLILGALLGGLVRSLGTGAVRKRSPEPAENIGEARDTDRAGSFDRHSDDPARASGPVRYIFVFLCAMAAAVIDETIQLFSDGRSAEVADVLLDSGGALAGIILFLAAASLIRPARRRGSGR